MVIAALLVVKVLQRAAGVAFNRSTARGLQTKLLTGIPNRRARGKTSYAVHRNGTIYKIIGFQISAPKRPRCIGLKRSEISSRGSARTRGRNGRCSEGKSRGQNLADRVQES